MPSRVRKRPDDDDEDVNEIAFRIVAESTSESTPAPPAEKPREKNPAAVALGKLGASKGGKARAAKLSAERRKEIARKAAQIRWASRE